MRSPRDASGGPRRVGPPPDVVRSALMQAAAPRFDRLDAMAGPMALPTSLLARLPTPMGPKALDLLIDIVATPPNLSALSTAGPDLIAEYVDMIALVRSDPGLSVLADVRARRDRCQI